MKLELANKNHAQEISDLLNLAYRGEEGWTTENRLIDGKRTTISDVQQTIENSVFLIYKRDNDLLACICLEKKEHDVYLGSFAVHPKYQTIGLGKSILKIAEDYAVNEMTAKSLVMLVVSMRPELTTFYERRGYKQSGLTQPFPEHLNVGNPKVNGLCLLQLRKDVETIV